MYKTCFDIDGTICNTKMAITLYPNLLKILNLLMICMTKVIKYIFTGMTKYKIRDVKKRLFLLKLTKMG